MFGLAAGEGVGVSFVWVAFSLSPFLYLSTNFFLSELDVILRFEGSMNLL